MNFVIDFDKEINEQWNEQSTTLHVISPSSIDIYNFPGPTGSTLTMQKIFWRDEALKKINEFFDLIKLPSWVSLNFKDPANLVVLEEFKGFNKVQFDISPLRIDLNAPSNINKLYTDLKQLLQLKNMTIVCKISQEKPCQELVNMLQYILVLKNKNYPGTVLFE